MLVIQHVTQKIEVTLSDPSPCITRSLTLSRSRHTLLSLPLGIPVYLLMYDPIPTDTALSLYWEPSIFVSIWPHPPIPTHCSLSILGAQYSRYHMSPSPRTFLYLSIGSPVYSLARDPIPTHNSLSLYWEPSILVTTWPHSHTHVCLNLLGTRYIHYHMTPSLNNKCMCVYMYVYIYISPYPITPSQYLRKKKQFWGLVPQINL